MFKLFGAFHDILTGFIFLLYYDTLIEDLI